MKYRAMPTTYYTGLGSDHDLDSTRILRELNKVFSEIIPDWPYRSSEQKPKTIQ